MPHFAMQARHGAILQRQICMLSGADRFGLVIDNEFVTRRCSQKNNRDVGSANRMRQSLRRHP